MRIFLSGSFKLCGDIFDHLEDTFKYVGEVVRMDRFWASQTLYDTTNWSKDKFWEIDCRCLSNCDVVIFCGDWMKHEGCRMEYERAKTEGKTILYADCPNALKTAINSVYGLASASKYCPHCGAMIKWPRKYMVVPQDEYERLLNEKDGE